MPSAAMRRIAANMSFTTSGDRPSEGSSSSSSRGRAISARAIATICCWPPDSDAAGACELARQHREQLDRARQRRGALRARGRQQAADLEVLAHGHAA